MEETNLPSEQIIWFRFSKIKIVYIEGQSSWRLSFQSQISKPKWLQLLHSKLTQAEMELGSLHRYHLN